MLKRLFRQSGLYAVANAAGKASGLVLVVFYGNPAYLSQEGLGYFGTVRATMMFALLVAGLGLPLGIIRFMSSREVPPEEQAAVPFTGLALATAGAVGIGLCTWALAPWLAVVFEGGDPAPFVWLAAYVAVKTVSDVGYQVLRQQERVGVFAAASIAELTIQAAAVIVFLVGFGEGVVGIVKGYVVAAVAVGVPLVAALLRRVEWRFSRTLVRPLLAFGLPLVVSGLAGRALYYGDRFFIVKIIDLEANGLYEWASSIGSVAHAFLVQSFQLAFTVLGIKALDAEGGRPDLHRRTFRHLTAGGGLMALGLGLFADDLTRLLVGLGVSSAYVGVGPLVFLIAGGFVFYALYYVGVNVLYAAGRTRTVAVGVVACGLLNIALNLALIPTLGLLGAALATLLSYAALAVGTGLLAERQSRAGYPWRRLAAVTALTAGLWLLAVPSADWPLAARLGARAGLCLAYVPLLLVAGVYGRADLDRLRGVLRHARRERGEEHGAEGAGSTPLPEDPPPGQPR